jgi:hypothetical protein
MRDHKDRGARREAFTKAKKGKKKKSSPEEPNELAKLSFEEYMLSKKAELLESEEIIKELTPEEAK